MLEAGHLLGHYKIVRKLGAGGMADVYEADDQRLKRKVALKVLPPEFTRNPDLVKRFEIEVLAAAGLNHRSIVTVYEVGQQEGLHFYSMRMLMGGDLRRRINAGLKPIEALAILRELAGAFDHAHGKNFVHRDVKPENVLFDDEGLPVLTDFGIAKALGVGSELTGTGTAIGTPRYLSPEQARGKPVDARADLYSLGVMLYEMLVGRPPYDAEDSVSIILKHVSDPIPQLPPECAQYQPLVDQLMAKKPDDRISSAKELRHRIDALQPRWASGNTPPMGNQTLANPAVQRMLTPAPLGADAPEALPAVTTGTRTTGTRGVAKILKKAAKERVPGPAAAAAAVPAAVASQPEVEGEASPEPSPSPLFMRLVIPGSAALGALLVAVAVWMFLSGKKAPEETILPAAETIPASVAAPATPSPVSSIEPAAPPKVHRGKRNTAADAPPTQEASIPGPAATQPAALQPASSQPASSQPTVLMPAPSKAEEKTAPAEVRKEPKQRTLRMEQMISTPASSSPASSSPASRPPTSRQAADSRAVDDDDPLVQRQREMEERRRKELEAEQKAAAQLQQEDEFLQERAQQLKQEQARREEARRKKEQEDALKKKQQEEAPKQSPPAATPATGTSPGG